ncbi:MAG TPA: hypothetical protein VG122_24380 [Gemmata sp.]|nr:hypothetical protein [Gemmata sp.]
MNAGLLQSVILRRSTNGGTTWSTVQQVQYAYYDGTTTNGNAGDLETATIEDPSSNVLGTYYYRYYTPTTDGSIGYTHGLEYELTPRSYAQLAGTGVNPLTATNAQLSPYADMAYEYNSSQRVTQVVVGGAGVSTTSGLGTYTYSYTTSLNSPGYNSWAVETVETLPDGSTNTVFTNSNVTARRITSRIGWEGNEVRPTDCGSAGLTCIDR